jgi:DNA-binding MarR family transcriptional regulator
LAASLMRGALEEDVPVGDGLLLLELGFRDGLSPHALAAALGVRRASVTSMIVRTAHYGLLRQEVDPDDRRSRRLFLTSIGRNMAEISWARIKSVEKRLEATIGEADLAALERIVPTLAAERILPSDLD